MKPKVTPTLRRVLRAEFPDMPLKKVLRLMEAGILRVSKDRRCGAYARSTGQPCKAKAIHGTWRCKNHGGAAKSEAGSKRISDAQKRRWAKWRAERGKP